MFFVSIASMWLAPAAAAADGPLEIRLEPWASHDGVDRPYRYILTARATTGSGSSAASTSPEASHR